MGFFEYIMNNFIRRRKRLPQAEIVEKQPVENTKVSNDANEFDERLSVGFTPIPKTLDFAIEQYVSGLLFQHQQGEFISSYKALTTLCSMNNDYGGNNAKNEEDLLDRLGNDDSFFVYSQPSASGGACFRHITHGKVTGDEKIRLYLNCKREHTAELASKFIEEANDMPYYFKFCADEHAAKTRRSEQFVFYVEDENAVNETMQVIERIKQKNPEMFQSSRYLNPFMKTISGYVGIAPNVSGVYKNLRGENIPVSQSYNSLLSEALEDALYHSVVDVVSRDFDLSTKVEGEKLPTINDYVETVLGDIVLDRPDAMKKLVSGVKQNLVTLSKLNPELQIKGIDLSKDHNKDLENVK